MPQDQFRERDENEVGDIPQQAAINNNIPLPAITWMGDGDIPEPAIGIPHSMHQHRRSPAEMPTYITHVQSHISAMGEAIDLRMATIENRLEQYHTCYVCQIQRVEERIDHVHNDISPLTLTEFG